MVLQLQFDRSPLLSFTIASLPTNSLADFAENITFSNIFVFSSAQREANFIQATIVIAPISNAHCECDQYKTLFHLALWNSSLVAILLSFNIASASLAYFVKNITFSSMRVFSSTHNEANFIPATLKTACIYSAHCDQHETLFPQNEHSSLVTRKKVLGTVHITCYAYLFLNGDEGGHRLA